MVNKQKLTELEELQKLAGQRILIVEDDESLPLRLIKEFEQCEACVTVKHTVESGLMELKESGTDYDLIVVDVMLPESEEDYQKIQQFRCTVKQVMNVPQQKSTGDANDKEASRLQEQAREKRRFILEQIDMLTCKDGGFQLVKQWVEELGGKSRPPIIYLTARSDPGAKQEGIEAAGGQNVVYLGKPVTLVQLLGTAVQVISEMKTG